MMFFSVRMKSEVGPDPDEAAAMLEMGLFDPIPIVLKGDPSAVDLLFASLPQTRREERDDEAHRQRASIIVSIVPSTEKTCNPSTCKRVLLF
ncbi:hypothetical protein OUZ56_012739 [Daphnia magna]|uniref:Uncharacterized protein n=1 Tax=Daphnia magna TaxID=35525 RepID=A0ABQ9Z3W8_9CRUS|nr:hypothetical protein OUZ56_012739 [Daphnia magna]